MIVALTRCEARPELLILTPFHTIVKGSFIIHQFLYIMLMISVVHYNFLSINYSWTDVNLSKCILCIYFCFASIAVRTEASSFGIMCLHPRMWKRAIKAFQNLQLTEHHLDSLQQSAAGAGGNERGRRQCEQCGPAELAGNRGTALLWHRTPYIPRPYHRADCMFVSVRVSQLPEACLRHASLYVQCSVLWRCCSHSCGIRGLFSSTSSWSAAFLYKCRKYKRIFNAVINQDHR